MTTICKVLLLIIANLFACWILLAAFALGYQYAKYTTFGIAEGYYHITQKAITAI